MRISLELSPTAASLSDVRTCVGSTGLSPLGRQCNPYAMVYNPSTVITGNPNQWFNPNMFITPLPGYLGTIGRGTLTGPGLFNWDFSVHKSTPIGLLGEARNLQFRAEFFNILNRANFNTPNQVVFTPALSPTAGVITTTSTNSRQIQFGLKMLW